MTTETRERAQSLARGAAAFAGALAAPCPAHDAEPGAACWPGIVRALCGARTRRAGYRLPVQPRHLTHRPRTPRRGTP
jgi:hypothetical protein